MTAELLDHFELPHSSYIPFEGQSIHNFCNFLINHECFPEINASQKAAKDTTLFTYVGSYITFDINTFLVCFSAYAHMYMPAVCLHHARTL